MADTITIPKNLADECARVIWWAEKYLADNGEDEDLADRVELREAHDALVTAGALRGDVVRGPTLEIWNKSTRKFEEATNG